MASKPRSANNERNFDSRPEPRLKVYNSELEPRIQAKLGQLLLSPGLQTLREIKILGPSLDREPRKLQACLRTRATNFNAPFVLVVLKVSQKPG